jgi:alkanesulfonate monooxygenase SsuD/methylene tetrahydromethanopterin reductase-like flavin-dependent oxidoreductase (luciferase family)
MRDAWVEQKPVQRPSPPIYIGALGSTRALTLVGEIADGWLPAHNTLELFRERVAVIREGARRVGRDPEAIDTGAAVIGVPTRDPEVRKKALEAYKATVLVLTPRRVLKAMGFDPQAPAGVRYFYQRALAHEDGARLAGEIAKAMPDELVEKFVVTGGPDQFIEAIDRYREAGARHIIFWDMVAESLQNSTERGIANLRVFHDKVMPYFGRSA